MITIQELQLRCRARNIPLDSALELPKDLSLGDAELCSVFSNLLDNAVRACAALPEVLRRIRLSAALRGSYLIIEERDPLPQVQMPRRPEGDHGLGLSILTEIARRRRGQTDRTGPEERTVFHHPVAGAERDTGPAQAADAGE